MYGKEDSIYPREPKKRALVNHFLFFDAATLYPRLRNITFPLWSGEGNKIPQKKLDEVEEAYGFLEEFLSRNKYIAGDDLTIADISVYTTTSGLHLLKEFNAQKYPKTQAWLQVLAKLPAVQKQNVKGQEMYKTIINSLLAA